MKKLNINITKAQLVSFEVKLEDSKPEVSVTIALLNDGGKVITTYTIYTHSWHDQKFKLPIEAMPLIGDIARILEGVAVRHCQDGQLALAAPGVSQTFTPKPPTKATLKGFPGIKDGTEITIIDEVDQRSASEIRKAIDDAEPIALDDIPF
jgi:hypothetical protein